MNSSEKHLGQSILMVVTLAVASLGVVGVVSLF